MDNHRLTEQRRSRLTVEFTCARLRRDLLPDRQPPCGWTRLPRPARARQVQRMLGGVPGSGGLAPDGLLLTGATTFPHGCPSRG